MDRYAEFFAFVGAPGRGKTTQLIQAIEFKLSKGDRALVIVPDLKEKAWFPYFAKNGIIASEDLEEKFNPNFKGVQLVEYEEKITFPFLQKLFKKNDLKNLNLVLDDPWYIEGRPEQDLLKVVKRARQMSCDVWTNAHHLDQIPQALIPYITVYGLMYTRGPIVLRRKQLGHLEEAKMYVDRVAGVSRTNKLKYHHIAYIKEDGTKYC